MDKIFELLTFVPKDFCIKDGVVVDLDTYKEEEVKCSRLCFTNCDNIPDYEPKLEEALNELVDHLSNEFAKLIHPEFALTIYFRLTEKVKAGILDIKRKLIDENSSLIYFPDKKDEYTGIQMFGAVKYNELPDIVKEDMIYIFDNAIKYADKLFEALVDLNTILERPQIAKRIKFNLSVGEIALLFNLLWNIKAIEAESKEDLFRTISANFQSNKAEGISVNSLRKKFQDHDKNSLSDINALLTNLRAEYNKLR